MVIWLHAGICSIVGRDINTLTLFLGIDNAGYSYIKQETEIFGLCILFKTRYTNPNWRYMYNSPTYYFFFLKNFIPQYRYPCTKNPNRAFREAAKILSQKSNININNKGAKVQSLWNTWYSLNQYIIRVYNLYLMMV